ncbi:hypothetical protein Ssi03_77000 [Sphaerisporangium siamense]|nr:hypothetical protein Ssi03_77000 [Sphaerisporangium siamense]
MTDHVSLTVGVATRPGTIDPSGDAAAVRRQADGAVAAAVVDGIGHSPQVAAVARMLAEVAARVAARRGPLAGLLTATELVADPGDDDEPEPDAVAVVAAVAAGDDRMRIAWVGDCRASLLDGEDLRPLTVDHNLAEQLAMCGYDGEPVRRAAHWVRTSVATAAVATVAEAWVRAPALVVLTSDGVHDQTPHQLMTALAVRHRADPQALADALTAAAAAGLDGQRDDATAVVLHLPDPAR